MTRPWVLGFLLSACMLLSTCDFSSGYSERALHARLWESLKKAEQYIASNEDDTYGYVYASGYPMYLWGVGTMYLYMWDITGDGQYHDKLIRCLHFIEASAEADWTWKSTSGKRAALYNWLFAELYTNVWKLTQSQDAKDTARSIVEGLLAPGMFDQATGRFVGDTSANGSFFPFLAIGYCLGALGESDAALQEMALQAYAYARSMYDPDTGQWYYTSWQMDPGMYDGHAAYYQSLELCYFLEYESEIKSIFPVQHDELESIAPDMIPVLIANLLPASTYYYSADVPDNTESAASNFLLFDLYDRRFATDHDDIIMNALQTVMARQYGDGAFYNTTADGTPVTSGSLVLWTSFEIVGYIAKYLSLHQDDVVVDAVSRISAGC